MIFDSRLISYFSLALVLSLHVAAGTFLCSHLKDRVAHNVAGRTTSLWAHMSEPEQRNKITNPLFERVVGWIRPSFRAVSLSIWLTLYGRWTHNLEPYDEAQMLVKFMKDRHDAVCAERTIQETRLNELMTEITALQKELAQERETLVLKHHDEALMIRFTDPLLDDTVQG